MWPGATDHEGVARDVPRSLMADGSVCSWSSVRTVPVLPTSSLLRPVLRSSSSSSRRSPFSCTGYVLRVRERVRE